MTARLGKVKLLIGIGVCGIWISAATALAGPGQILQEGAVTVFVQSDQALQAGTIDYRNAKPMPLPIANAPALDSAETAVSFDAMGEPGFSPGAPGTGRPIPQAESAEPAELPMNLPTRALPESEGGIVPQEYGTSAHPFTTSRVDLLELPVSIVSRLYPYRAAGKLYFNIGADSYICSASLIKKGLIVTAAHCVAEFGTSQFFSNWRYVPAMYGNFKPFGTWSVTKARVMTSYLNGTDTCSPSSPGVVCANDVAVLTVAPQNGVYPGTSTGYFAYGWNGYGFATPTSGPKIALINQLGYPASHDGGLKMQRTDSQGFVSASQVNNTVWGSRQTGGSSGGPELVNLGARSVLSEGVGFGTGADFNVVVGVTSWGYSNQAVKQQGASPFKDTNIVSLVDAACAETPAACTP